MEQEENTGSKNSLEYIVCSPLGSYPSESFTLSANGIYIKDEMICLAYPAHLPFQKEMLVTALLTANNFKQGFLKLYLLPFTHTLDSFDAANISEQLVGDLKHKKSESFVANGDILPEFDQYENAKGASLPLALGGVPYHRINNLVCEENFSSVMEAIQSKDYPELFEIIELLQESSQLSCHLQFQVQASHYLLQAIILLNEIDWAKQHPLLNEWLNKNLANHSFKLAKGINPIEYVKLYKTVVITIRNSILS
ncbi:hypothetical protein [Kangiella sp. HZ709]|uniref:hypothetical protein n=1 Tax=Kangiella sp. HZ709 TaxID=2666328 RepID=UPI0012B14EF5|nr:hypothetical protein [Kangiella sp. HZ709]MRX28178.1 hypothetical protein [Kangiella sp. HZ709]